MVKESRSVNKEKREGGRGGMGGREKGDEGRGGWEGGG